MIEVFSHYSHVSIIYIILKFLNFFNIEFVAIGLGVAFNPKINIMVDNIHFL